MYEIAKQLEVGEIRTSKIPFLPSKTDGIQDIVKKHVGDIRFEDLKKSNASKEDWEKKYNDLVEDNRIKAEEKAKQDLEAQERAEFDKYFADNNKEWNNPFIADGYFGKFKEAKALDENKGKMSADILHELTKDDATAFKTTQPIVTLKGAAGGTGGPEALKEIPTIF